MLNIFAKLFYYTYVNEQFKYNLIQMFRLSLLGLHQLFTIIKINVENH